MNQLNYESNPLVAYLNQETLKPGEFGILAGHRPSMIFDAKLGCATTVVG